jgi:energy-coupling factor transporter ATP-binding protein EcfA2
MINKKTTSDQTLVRCKSIEEWNKKKIIHPAQERAIEQVMACLEGRGEDDNLIVLPGPSGVGKSTLLELITTRINREWMNRLKANSELLPVVPIEAFKTPEKRSIWKALCVRTLTACGDPLPDKKRAIDPKSAKTAMGQASEKETTDAMIMAIVNQFQHRETVLWIIDEAHHFLFAGLGRTQVENLETLKSICNATNTKCLLLGPYELAEIIGTSDQLIRRSHIIHLAAYGNDKEANKEFINAARNLIFYLPYKMSQAVTDEVLAFGSLRCIGLLKVWVRKAAYLARRRSEDFISLKLMQETRFTAKQLAVFATRMTAGEMLLRDDSVAEDELRRFLGFPVDKEQEPTPKSRNFNAGGGSTPGEPQKPKLNPGERGLGRDVILNGKFAC